MCVKVPCEELIESLIFLISPTTGMLKSLILANGQVAFSPDESLRVENRSVRGLGVVFALTLKRAQADMAVLIRVICAFHWN